MWLPRPRYNAGSAHVFLLIISLTKYRKNTKNILSALRMQRINKVFFLHKTKRTEALNNSDGVYK